MGERDGCLPVCLNKCRLVDGAVGFQLQIDLLKSVIPLIFSGFGRINVDIGALQSVRVEDVIVIQGWIKLRAADFQLCNHYVSLSQRHPVISIFFCI